MPSDPIRVISAADVSGPSTPMRIANWSEFIDAIVTAIETGELTTLYALQAYMGDYTGGNYTHFLTDGTMRAVGDATCYRDELQSVTGAQITSPAGDFQQNIAEASVTAKASARYPTDYITTNWQLNHDWELGSAIYPHIHWWQTSVNMPNWLLAYRWQVNGAVKTTAWTLQKWDANAYTYTAGTLNQITGFGAITPPVGYGEVSDIVQIRLYRDVTDASTEFGAAETLPIDQDIMNLDAHIIVDTLGSRKEYEK